jgi:hypothetical protein
MNHAMNLSTNSKLHAIRLVRLRLVGQLRQFSNAPYLLLQPDNLLTETSCLRQR